MSSILESLVTQDGCEVVRMADLDDFFARHPRALLFLTGDTVHRPEGLDVAVVVRELLAAYRGRLVVGLIDRRDETAVMPRFGVVVLPAVVYVRDGQATELVARMRDWPVFAQACDRLLSSGIPVLNQSVLLRGVNDDFRTMQELLYGLERIGVKPYYLFQCDPVQGTDHFRVEIWEGMRIMEKLWKTTSGLCLPRYVADMPGTKGKVPLQPVSFL